MRKAYLCHTSQVPGGEMRAFDVEGLPVLVANVAGRIYAIGNVCTHSHAELSGGTLDENECTVECPLHNAVFSLESGDALEFPAELPVPTYAVLIEGGNLYIEIPSR